jgi:hypothetical protein
MRATLAILLLFIDRRLCATVGLITIGLTALMSILLLLSSGKPGQFLKTLEQRIAAVGGLLGLSYAASDLFWRFYGDLLHSRFLAIGFYVGWKLLGGMFLAMLVCILAPRNIKALLSVSVALLVTFNLLVVLGYSIGRLIGALIFPSLEIGFLIGMAVRCGILLWIEKPEKNAAPQPEVEAVVAGP